MNQLRAKVTKIKNRDTLHLITLHLQYQSLKLLSLELPPTLKIDSLVSLEIKPSNIILTPSTNKVKSSANQLQATVKKITQGELVSSIEIEIDTNRVEALISLDSFKELEIDVDDEVIALINLSDISVC